MRKYAILFLLLTGCAESRRRASSRSRPSSSSTPRTAASTTCGLFRGRGHRQRHRRAEDAARPRTRHCRSPAGVRAGRLGQRFPTAANGPFRIDAPPVNRRLDEVLPNPIHVYYQNREQINGGPNNKFVAMSNVGAWVMGYFDGSKMKMWKWAKDYTLADHFFMGAYGGSYLNHQWLVCACTPKDVYAPANQRAQVDERGNVRKRPDSPPSVMQGPVALFDGRVSPDGYAVNTAQPPISQAQPLAAGEPSADPAGIWHRRREEHRRRSRRKASPGPGTPAGGTRQRATAARIPASRAASSTRTGPARRRSSRITSRSTTTSASRPESPTASVISRTTTISSPPRTRARCRRCRSTSRWAASTSTLAIRR